VPRRFGKRLELIIERAAGERFRRGFSIRGWNRPQLDDRALGKALTWNETSEPQ
jgi:hypothetical protein